MPDENANCQYHTWYISMFTFTSGPYIRNFLQKIFILGRYFHLWNWSTTSMRYFQRYLKEGFTSFHTWGNFLHTGTLIPPSALFQHCFFKKCIFYELIHWYLIFSRVDRGQGKTSLNRPSKRLWLGTTTLGTTNYNGY